MLGEKSKADFTYGFRTLSDSMNASVLVLAKQAIRLQSQRLQRPQPAPIPVRAVFEEANSQNSGVKYIEEPIEVHSNRKVVMISVVVAFLIVVISGVAIGARAFVSWQKNANTHKIEELVANVDKFMATKVLLLPDDETSQGITKNKEQYVKDLESVKGESFISDQQKKTIEDKIVQLNEYYSVIESTSNQFLKQYKNIEDDLTAEIRDYPRASDINSKKIEVKDLIKFGFDNFQESLECKTYMEQAKELYSGFKERLWLNIEALNGEFQDVVISEGLNFVTVSKLEADDPNAIEPTIIGYSFKLNEMTEPNALPWKAGGDFVEDVTSDYDKLQTIKKEISGFSKDKSLSNAKDSPIEEHEKFANQLFKQIEDCKTTMKLPIDNLKWLKNISTAISQVEEDDVVDSFVKYLKVYEQNVDKNGSVEEFLVKFKTAISE